MLAHLYDVCRKAISPKSRLWLKRQPWFMPFTKMFLGTHVYSRSYYEDVERIEKESICVIGGWIAENINPKRVIDVGCGPGHLIENLSKHNINVYGIDASEQAEICVRRKGLAFSKADLREEVNLQRFCRAPDLVVCFEVAEHLEERYADTLVKSLTSAGCPVIFTAAEPNTEGFVGMHHFNEQFHDYWISKFMSNKYALDDKITLDAREYFQRNQVICYLSQPMYFKKQRTITTCI